MLIRDLARSVPGAALSGPEGATVRSIQVDSRLVRPGDLFVAYRGIALDSHSFVPDAIARGARAVVVEHPVAVPAGIACLLVPSGRAAWAWLSAAWFEFPSRNLKVIGVTGTDGKTTTASLIGAILTADRRPVGLVTTVAAEIAGRSLDTGFHTTTPEPPDIQAILREMVRHGSEIAVLETTSHALALDKVLGIDYDVAVLTNVTHEHLDFHGSWDDYLAAKACLFRGLGGAFRKPGVPKIAVLNADDSSFGLLRGFQYDRMLSYAVDAPADVTAVDARLDGQGSRFVARTPIGDFPLETRMLGPFNVANVLAAIGAAIGLGVGSESIRSALSSFQGIPGRLEVIDQGQPFGVVVDFAHTPSSLHRVLELARTLARGQIAVVFGCAGQRDVAKRPLMGQAAGNLADRVYLTAEDPRTEDLASILAQIAAGVRDVGREPRVIPDRSEAILAALSEARPHDLVLITGKGHEQTMCFGVEERPWDDRKAVREALAGLGYRAGLAATEEGP